MGTCAQTGWIVWTNGPFPPGDWPDLDIARDELCSLLEYGELFLADGTYAGATGYVETPNGLRTQDQYMKQKARSLHERVNGFFKVFGAMEKKFRHNKRKHGLVFLAIANVVQAHIQLEGRPFDLEYYDNYDY